MKTILLIGLGGGLGSIARYLTVQLAAWLLGPQLPWGTLAVNMVGGFLMGLVTGAFEGRTHDPALRLAITTGVLGGFTTFSAFSLDAVRLLQDEGTMAGSAYIVASVALSVAGVMFGLAVARFAFMSAP
jgi:fluoride exporter